jgi:DNA-binding LacI/PurR family transcriptional regulator
MIKGQRPRLGDVARRAGVSPGLASLALRNQPGPSEASRQAVLKAARELGYRVNSAASVLAKTRPHLIGVAFSLSQSFHVEAVEHIYRFAELAGYAPLLSAVTDSRPLERAVDPLISGSCEGILILGMDRVPEALRHPASALPIVVLGHAPWDGSFDVVRTAGDLGVQAAVEKLVDLGHTRIVHIDGGTHSGAEERRAGYLASMRRLGLAAFSQIEAGGNRESDGLRAGRLVFSASPDTTAVICYNDSCAVGAMQAAEEAGLRIPADLSIIGYDNSPVARTRYLSLTTVAQDIPTLAKLAVERLIAAIDDPELERCENVLPPYLIERATTGPAPARDTARP